LCKKNKKDTQDRKKTTYGTIEGTIDGTIGGTIEGTILSVFQKRLPKP